MSDPTPEYKPSPWDAVAEHVDRYLSTGGEDGYEWEGAKCIILTTVGRKSGNLRRTPLIRVPHDDGYLVVASMGGAPQHPNWYFNVQENPDVVIDDRDQTHKLRARTASADEKAELWSKAVAEWPDYANYQAATDRDIPLVVCEPR